MFRRQDGRWLIAAALFQRIDHTALVVEELDPSTQFYRRLGFELDDRFTSGSDAQQRLNNVFGAHLEIASLKLPGDDFGVELLRYVTPPGGRPIPRGTKPNDLVHRRTVVGCRTPAGSTRSCAPPGWTCVRQRSSSWIGRDRPWQPSFSRIPPDTVSNCAHPDDPGPLPYRVEL